MTAKVSLSFYQKRHVYKVVKMPKGGKGKKKKEKQVQDEGATGLLTVPQTCLGDDSDSVCSSIPDSVLSDELLSEGATEESDSDSELQFQLSEHIDHLSDKNTQTRLSALSCLTETLKHKMVTQLLSGRVEGLIDILIKGVKKVRGQERHDLLLLVSLVALQFGDEHPELCVALHPGLVSLLHDPTVTNMERSAALSTLTLCTFLMCQDMKQVETIMHECETVYHTIKIDNILTAAVKGWALLLSIVPDHAIPNIFASQLSHLTTILESSSNLELKVATGQAIALLLELARETDDELLDCEEFEVVCGVVQTIAAESNRYTGRRERNQQRSSFRDIAQTVETGSVPERQIKFGLETLHLDSWSKLVQYSTITDLLATGSRTHFQNNELLRDIFQLGTPPLVQQESKADKIERKLYNAAVAKWRSQSRGKQRDKRAVL